MREMKTIPELREGDAVEERRPGASAIARRIADHRTLCVGILYAMTIAAILAVARLF